jgi:hypothetical protein
VLNGIGELAFCAFVEGVPEKHFFTDKEKNFW